MNFGTMLEQMKAAFSLVIVSIINFLPNFLVAIVIILIGIGVARLVRDLVVFLLKNPGRFIPLKIVQSYLHPSRLEKPAQMIGRILFWIIVFFFATLSTEVLGLPAVTTWMSGIAAYLPNILVAALIILIGAIGGAILRDIISSAMESAKIDYGGVLGRLTQYTVLLVSIFIAIQQIGVNITFLTSAVLILLTALLLAAALAFGLGARASVSNILAAHYLQKIFKAGQIIRIGDMEGIIEEIAATAVILKTAEGRLYIPTGQFNEMTSILIKEGA